MRERSCSFPSSVVIDPFFLQDELNQRNNHNDGEQGVGDGGSIAHLDVDKALLINSVYQHIGRASRSALGHDIDQVEFLEGGNNDCNQAQENGGGKHGQRDIAEGIEAAGSVNPRRFVQIDGDSLQTRQENDHVVTKVFPNGYDNDGCQGPVLIQQPARQILYAQRAQNLIHRAVGGQNDIPYRGNSHHGGDVGEEADGAQRGFAPDFGIEQQCDQQRDDQYARSKGRGVNEVIRQGDTEGAVLGKQPDIIGKAVEIKSRARVSVACEAQQQSIDHRISQKGQEED